MPYQKLLATFSSAQLHELIRRLRTVAGRHGAVYVDYHRHLAADDGLTLRCGLADDGLHPHVVGYDIMAGVLLDTLADAGIDILAARQMG